MARVNPNHNKAIIFQSCVRGYHVYKDTWTAELGEELYCEIEQNNEYDKYAVSVKKNDEIVGHIPLENSKVSHFFLKRGGTICCVVTGKRENNGCGLQIPAEYTYTGSKKDTEMLKKLLKTL